MSITQASSLGPPEARARAGVIDVARWCGITAVLGFAGYHLGAHWSEFWRTLADIPPVASSLSLVMVLISITASTYGWQMIADDLGPRIGYFRGAQIYLVGQLGKYAPGSVWGYLLQMELGRKAGVARARVFAGSVVHFAITVVTAMMVGLIALPVIFEATAQARWIPLLLPIGLVALHPSVLTRGTSLVLRVLRRPGLDRPLRARTVGAIMGAIVVAFLFQGMHLWLLAGTAGPLNVSGLGFFSGAMALSMLVGTMAFFLPAGVGAREAVLVAVLTVNGIGVTQALAFAAASRVMFVVADLVLAGGSALSARLERPRRAS